MKTEIGNLNRLRAPSRQRFTKKKYCGLFIPIIFYLLRTIRTRFYLIRLSIVLFFLGLFSFNVFSALPVVQAVKTVNTIQGSAPYLTFDGGKSRAYTTYDLFVITLPDGREFNYSNNVSSTTNPIQLTGAPTKVKDIKTIIPYNQTADSSDQNKDITAQQSMTDVLNSGPYWFDVDGDGEITATGHFQLIVKNANNQVLSLDDELNDCEAPYSFRLMHDGSDVTTKYGDPNHFSLNYTDMIYYLNPAPGACSLSAKPNLFLSDTNKTWSGSNYSGPQGMWDDAKGFRQQSFDNSELNFPTMAANGLLFTIDLADSASNMSFTKIPADSGIDLEITSKGNQAKITLTGPADGASLQDASKAAVATTFILYADKAKTQKLYSFTIKKWFIAKKTRPENFDEAAKQYCRDLGYQLPTVSQLTNANSKDSSSYWDGGLAGQGNNYQRRIGGGLFAEWGEIHLNSYPQADIYPNEIYLTSNDLQVYSNMGQIQKRGYGSLVCISPN